MASRTSAKSAEYARRRAERAKLLGQAKGLRVQASAARAKGGTLADAKALDLIAKAKELEAQAYAIRLRSRYTGGPRRVRSKGVIGWLAKLGGS